MKRVTKTRYEVEWVELTNRAKARRAADPLDEHDHDRDEVTYYKVFLKQKDAQAYARKVVDSGVTVYGCATVTLQRLDRVEDTPLWEWENVGEPEYVE